MADNNTKPNSLLTRWSQFNLCQMGGLAAWFGAFAYIAGMGIMLSLLAPLTDQSLSTSDKLSFLVAHKDLYQAWILLIYVAFGIALVFLVIALHQMMSSYRNEWLVVGTAFGLIWAGMVISSGMVASISLDLTAPLLHADPHQATTLWLSSQAVHKGLGGGIEVVGGMWVILVSTAALKAQVFPRALNYLGIMTGNIGLLTAIPSLGHLGAAFGLLQIGWFIWLGLQLLAVGSTQASASHAAFDGIWAFKK